MTLAIRKGSERAKRHTARAIVFVASVAIFLTVFEATVRIDDWVVYRTPILTPVNSVQQLVEIDNNGSHGKPGAMFRKWKLNNQGMRSPETSLEKPDGVFRIITVGASETFGLYESADREYPRQLEQLLEKHRTLNQLEKRGITRIEVLNAALLGMTLPTVTLNVKNRLSRFKPDMILYYPTPVDYLADVPPGVKPPRGSVADTSLGGTFKAFLHPRLIDKFRDQIKLLTPDPVKDWLRQAEIESIVSGNPKEWLFDTVPGERLERYGQDLTGFVNAVSEAGATPVLVTHANRFTPGEEHDQFALNSWRRFYPRATGKTILAFDDEAAELTLKVAQERGAVAIDLRSAAHGWEKSAFADFSHFTDSGAAKAADVIARSLIIMHAPFRTETIAAAGEKRI